MQMDIVDHAIFKMHDPILYHSFTVLLVSLSVNHLYTAWGPVHFNGSLPKHVVIVYFKLLLCAFIS